MSGPSSFGAVGLLAFSVAASAQSVHDGAGERIAAHFELQSSRLLDEDAKPLAQFVSKVLNTPGARLAVLLPVTKDAAQARFVAARVAELERRVRSLIDTAEFRKTEANAASDLLWLTFVPPPPPPAPPLPPPPPRVDERRTGAVPAGPIALLPSPAADGRGRPESVAAPAPSSAADLQLTDWILRGVKHPPQGPAHAYISKLGSDAPPRELIERQTDKDFGLVKDISLSPEGRWIIHTEIGWIGQGGPSGGRGGAGK